MDDFRQISDCLPAWLTAENGKRADPEGPASATGQRQREGEALADTAYPGQDGFRALLTVSRHRRVTSPNGSPRPVARLCLVIDNGGGARREGGSNVRRLRVSPRSKASELGWVVM